MVNLLFQVSQHVHTTRMICQWMKWRLIILLRPSIQAELSWPSQLPEPIRAKYSLLPDEIFELYTHASGVRANVENKLKSIVAVRCSLHRVICYNSYWPKCQLGVRLQTSSNTLQPATPQPSRQAESQLESLVYYYQIHKNNLNRSELGCSFLSLGCSQQYSCI